MFLYVCFMVPWLISNSCFFMLQVVPLLISNSCLFMFVQAVPWLISNSCFVMFVSGGAMVNQ